MQPQTETTDGAAPARRSARAASASTAAVEAKAAFTAKKASATKKAATATKKTATVTTGADGAVVKRKVGRPRKNPLVAGAKDAPAATKIPGRRGRKPKSATASQQGSASVEDQVANLEVTPAKAKKEAKATSAVAAGKKRKSEEAAAEPASKRVDVAKPGGSTPGKRGRPPGTGKKQVAAAAAAAAPSGKGKETKVAHSASSDDKEETDGDFGGIKLTIERCTTCTQYHKNVNRIFKAAKEMYPHALCHEEVVPNSKSFEIFVSNNGSKSKLIWSGKAHAPPKRLAFPDTDVFVDLLKAEIKDEGSSRA